MTQAFPSNPRRFWLLAGAIAVLVVLAAQPAAAQAPAEGDEPAPLPEGLRHVPDTAMLFYHVRVGDLLKTAFAKTLLKAFAKDKDAAKLLGKLEDVDYELAGTLMVDKGMVRKIPFNKRGTVDFSRALEKAKSGTT